MTQAVNDEKLKYKDGQEYCIENPNGICLAIAGPGTGKTYAIAHRIKNIIKNGISSDRILCLTFTDAASFQMNKSIKEALLKDNIESDKLEVNICTFHSFCMNIIKNYTDEFELKDGVKVITDSVSRMFIKDITDEIESECLKTESGSRYQYIDAILNGIKEIKKFNMSKEEYFQNLEDNDISENEKNKTAELWKFYEKYEAKKNERGYIDFADMIIMVVKKFKNKEFLKKVAELYDYILVDEYQDTNPLQNEIIYSLGEFCQNIFAVGDDDQTIYSFQGARITTMKEYIEHFEKAGRQVDVVTFNNNRRSTKNIIDISRELVLIQRDYGKLIEEKEASKGISKPKMEKIKSYKPVFIPLEFDEKFKKYCINKELKSANQDLINQPAECTEYKDENSEQFSIINKIKELSKNVPLSEIAILARSNRELEKYSDLLKKNDIDFELKEGKNIFEINAVNVLISYLELMISPDLYSGKFFSYLLSPVFNINPDDFTKIYKRRASGSIIQTMRAILETEDKDIKFSDDKKIKAFLNSYDGLNKSLDSVNNSCLDGLKDLKEAAGLEEVILNALNETGILDYYINIETNKVENLLGFKKFAEEAKAYSEIHKDLKGASNLAGFLNYIRELNNDDVKIPIDKPEYKLNAVQLSTYHSSKGKEYKYVFMPAINKGKWESKTGGGGIRIIIPYKKDRALEAKLADDSLLGYERDWIKTEAKHMELIKLMFVGITRAKEGLYLSYISPYNASSAMLKIIRKAFENREKQLKFIDYTLDSDTEENYIKTLCDELKCKRYDYKKDFNELIEQKLNENKSFSPTKLNNWLNCRRRFLLEEVLSLGLKTDADFTLYGSAVHDALDKTVKYAIKEQQYPSFETIMGYFKESMDSYFFSPEGKKEYEAKGGIKLKKYYEFIKSQDVKNLYKSEELIDKFQIKDEKFTGKIDRIDKDENENYIIYDYKTGAAKKPSDIAPNGKYENYYNQIAFYKYLFHKKENVDIDKIRTIFLFPDDSKETEVILSRQDCINVLDKYFDVINKLRQCNFDKGDTENKEKTCKFCSCISFCNMNMIE